MAVTVTVPRALGHWHPRSRSGPGRGCRPRLRLAGATGLPSPPSYALSLRDRDTGESLTPHEPEHAVGRAMIAAGYEVPARQSSQWSETHGPGLVQALAQCSQGGSFPSLRNIVGLVHGSAGRPSYSSPAWHARFELMQLSHMRNYALLADSAATFAASAFNKRLRQDEISFTALI